MALELTEGSSFNGLVTYVTGEGKWLKVFVQFDEIGFKQVTRILEGYEPGFQKESGFVVQNQLPVGTAVCVKFSDGKYYRAKVRSWPPALPHAVQIKLLDYGNTEIVNVSDLRKGEDYLYQITPQATECYLADVTSKLPTWSPEAITFCESLIQYKQIRGLLIGKYESFPIIKLYINEIQVAHILIQRGFGEAIPDADSDLLHGPVNPGPRNYGMPPLTVPPPIQTFARQAPVRSYSGEMYHTIPLEVRKSYRVYVCHIEHSHRFFVQLTTNEMTRRVMEQMINNLIHSGVAAGLENLSPGIPCIAKCEEEDGYQRAIIVGFDTSGYQTFFVDSGVTEAKRPEQLLTIPRELISTPVQALECSLEPSISIDPVPFRSATAGKIFDMVVLSKTGQQYVVRLLFQQRNFVETILQSPELPAVPAVNLLKYRYLLTGKGDCHRVQVSYLQTLSEIYCQLVSNASVLFEINKEILNFVSLEPCKPISKVEAEQIGFPVCAKYLDNNNYFRGEIAGPISNNKVPILFVDYGNTTMVDLKDLFQISQNLLEYPVQAVKFKLRGIEGNMTESPNLLHFFEEVTKDKQVVAEIINASRENHHLVVMFETGNKVSGHSINDQLMLFNKKNVTPPPSEAFPAPLVRMDGLIVVPLPEVNPVEKLFITNYNSINDFFGQLCKYSLSEFEVLEQKIQDHYNRTPFKRFALKANAFVCARYTENNQFYRAKILNVLDHKAEIFYIDYGNHETCDHTNIFQLLPEFSQQPQLGIQCNLKDLPDSVPLDKLNELMNEETIEVSIVEHNPAQHYIVKLSRNELNEPITKLIDAHNNVQTSYIQPSIEIGRSEEVMVLDVESFSKFYCQLQRNKVQLDEMMEQIETYYGALTADAGILWKPPNGAICVAKFSEDEGWYRGEVLSSGSGGKYKVLYVDYGNSEEVSAEDIKALKVEFLQLPQQAILCGIADLKDVDASPANVERFGDAILEQPLTALFSTKSKTDQSYLVTLKDQSGNNIISQFVTPKTRTTESSYGSENKSNNNWGNSNDNWKSNSVERNDKSAGYKNSPPRKSEPSRNSFQNNQDRTPPRSVTQNHVSSPPRKKEHTEYHFEDAGLRPLSYVDVLITHVNNPGDFYCQLLDQTGNKLSNLTEELFSFYNNGGESIQGLNRGDPCVAMSAEDDTWYRAKILNINRGMAEVLFVDYGNSESVPMNKAKKLQTKFFDLPLQGIKCSLFNTLPSNGNTWAPDAISQFRDSVLDKTLIAQLVAGNATQGYKVNLINIKNETNLMNQVLISSGLGKTGGDSTTILSSAINVSTKGLRCAEIKSGFRDTVEVTWLKTPTEFYCQLSSTSAVFTSMMEKMQTAYNKLPELDGVVKKLSPGMFCVSRFTEDMVWYRAQIAHIKGNQVGVCYVDYGNCEEVLRKSIKFLASEFDELPIQGVQCKLNDITFDREPKLETCQKYYTGDELVCTFLKQSQNEHSVNLECDGKDVVQAMISDGIAKGASSSSSSLSSSMPVSVTSPSAYSSLSLNTAEEYKAMTIFYLSPHDFYCHLTPTTKLDALMTKLQARYSASQPDQPDLTVGQPCMAKYTEDDQWYRAQIKDSSSSQGIEVFFVDYGNSEKVAQNQLRKISPEFQELPGQAVLCSVHAIASTIAEETGNSFYEAVDDKELSIKIKNICTEPFGVKHFIHIFDKSVDPPVDINLSVFGPPVAETPGAAAVSAVKSVSSVQLQDGYVSHIDALSSFFVQLASEEETLNNLMAELEAASDFPPLDTNNLFQNDLCCALYEEDGSWYRARAIKIENNAVLLQFMDYGNKATVPFDSIRELPQHLKSTPAFATECRLKDYEAKPGSESATEDAFHGLVHDKTLKVVVFTNTEPNSAEIHDENGSIADVLLEKELIVPSAQKSIESSLSSKEDTASGSDVGYISASEGPLSFYIQLSSNTDPLAALSLQLLELSESLPELNSQDFKIGTLCVTQFSEDEQWYRAKITAIEGDSVTVRFLDYGNTDVITSSNIKSLTDDIQQIPLMAVHCKLDGVDVIPGKEVEAAENFSTLTLDEELSISYRGSGSPTPVKLTASHGDVIDSLIKSGLVQKLPDVPEQTSDGSTQASPDFPLNPTYLEREPPAGDTPLDMFVSHIAGLDNFFVINSEHESNLSKMVEDLEQFYGNSEADIPSASQISEGMPCVAQFTEDEAWYRAQVLHVHGDEATVRFVDYGNEDVVCTDKLKLLTNKFLIDPPYAVQCQFFGFQPMTNLEAEVVDFFTNIAIDKATSTVIFTDLSKRPYDVELTCDDILVVEHLKAANLVTSVEQQSYEQADVPTDEEVIVSHLSSISSFHLQWSCNEKDISDLVQKVDQFYSAGKGKPLSDLAIGTPCCSKFTDDDTWYRSEIIKVEGDEITVRFMDYGNFDVTTAEFVKQIDRQFLIIPSYAFLCKLDGIREIPDKDSVDVFTKLYENKTLRGKITGYGFPHPVMLTVDGEDVAASLVAAGVAEEYHSPIEASSETELTTETSCTDNKSAIETEVTVEALSTEIAYKDRDIPFSRKTMVTVSHVESPSEFYVQLQENSQSLEELTNSIYEMSTKLTEEDLVQAELTPGNPCLALFDADLSYYRAKVLSANENGAEVLFVDYGNTAVVKPQSVSTLSTELLFQSPHAIKCSLHGVLPTSTDPEVPWSPETCEEFSELITVEGQKLLAQFVEKVGDVATVKLFDMGMDVATVLVDLGAASLVEVEHIEDEEDEDSTETEPVLEDGITENSLCPDQQSSADSTEIAPENEVPIVRDSEIESDLKESEVFPTEKIQPQLVSNTEISNASPVHRPLSREDKMVPGVIAHGMLSKEEELRDAFSRELISKHKQKIIPSFVTTPLEEQLSDNEDEEEIPTITRLKSREIGEAMENFPEPDKIFVRPPNYENNLVPGMIAQGLVEEETRMLEMEVARAKTPKGPEEKILCGTIFLQETTTIEETFSDGFGSVSKTTSNSLAKNDEDEEVTEEKEATSEGVEEVTEVESKENGVIDEKESKIDKEKGITDEKEAKSDEVVEEKLSKSDEEKSSKSDKEKGVPDEKEAKSDEVVEQKLSKSDEEKSSKSGKEKSVPDEKEAKSDEVVEEKLSKSDEEKSSRSEEEKASRSDEVKASKSDEEKEVIEGKEESEVTPVTDIKDILTIVPDSSSVVENVLNNATEKETLLD